MKRRFALLAIFVLVMAFTLTIFGDFREVETICQELLNKRAIVWNRIFDNDYNIEDFSNDIKLLAADMLLLEDIEAFKYFRDNPTDIEKVQSLELFDVKVGKNGSSYVVKGMILWNIESQEGIESIIDCYHIEMKKIKGNWYLTALNVIE